MTQKIEYNYLFLEGFCAYLMKFYAFLLASLTRYLSINI